jgi:hypothetical protein
MMAVVHDLAEAQGKSATYLMLCVVKISTDDMAVGDITPRESISKQEKQRLEAVSLSYLATPQVVLLIQKYLLPNRKQCAILCMICSMALQQRYESKPSGT